MDKGLEDLTPQEIVDAERVRKLAIKMIKDAEGIKTDDFLAALTCMLGFYLYKVCYSKEGVEDCCKALVQGVMEFDADFEKFLQ